MPKKEAVVLYINTIDYSVSQSPKIGYERQYTRLYGLHSSDCEITVFYIKYTNHYSHNELMNAVMIYGEDSGDFSAGSLYFDTRKRPCGCNKKRVDIDGNIQSSFMFEDE